MYAPPMFLVSWGAWLRFGFTCPNDNAVVNGLKPSCDELQRVVSENSSILRAVAAPYPWQKRPTGIRKDGRRHCLRIIIDFPRKT